MFKLLLYWLMSALALLFVSHFVDGFDVQNLQAALIATLVIGFLNATVGLFLKILTLPLSILTLGLFLLVINALMIMLASHFVGGFRVTGWLPAFVGALVLALVGLLFKAPKHKVS